MMINIAMQYYLTMHQMTPISFPQFLFCLSMDGKEKRKQNYLAKLDNPNKVKLPWMT